MAEFDGNCGDAIDGQFSIRQLVRQPILDLLNDFCIVRASRVSLN
jgi:hypothetical protein